ncbi:MAG: Panacea domain-containing protein [Candidatus Omnitrophota bacterium]
MDKKMYFPVEFRFKVDKFIACLTLFAKANLKNLDKLKAAKLIYFADKYHLTHYGRPIIGDRYVHLDNGPIPSTALDVMNEVSEDRPVQYKEAKSNKRKFEEFLKIEKEGLKYPVFIAIKEPNLNCLSETEIEAVEKTIKKYGKYSPGALIELTHKDASWQRTQKNEGIDYRLFFEDDKHNKVAKEAREYMESMSEINNVCSLMGFHD